MLTSVLAGALGAGCGAAMLWTVTKALHPALLPALIGAPLALTVIPGHVIGLIDRRHWPVTVLAAMWALALGNVAATRGMVSAPVPLLVAAVVALALALLSAYWATRTSRPVLWAGVLMGLYVLVFVAPEINHWRSSRRFVERRLPEVMGFVSDEVATIPRGPTWQYQPTGGLFPGVRVSTRWEVAADSPAPGRYTLGVVSSWRSLEGPLHRQLHEVQLNYSPTPRRSIGAQAEAASLLRELGAALPPGGLEPRRYGSWAASWTTRPYGGPTIRHEVTITREGHVSALWIATW